MTRVDYGTRTKLFRPAISEIDWSVGQILDALKENGLDENTVVIFTSDNGPATGKADPLRGRKGSTFEGGMREPTVIRWPGNTPAGVVNDELMTAMDLLPTFARLAGAELPADRAIDGKDIWPVLTGKEKSPHEAFFYYRGGTLADPADVGGLEEILGWLCKGGEGGSGGVWGRIGDRRSLR